MRLLNCQLQNVRLHRDLSIDFSQRITLISGANETGKSTLVEALHRAFFLKATASGAPVAAMQSRVHMGPPVISIGFEAKGDQWTLKKRFSGNSGQTSLLSEASGKSLNGPIAEEVLAELLGFKDTLGSKQATTVLPTRWAHLWVMQGFAGDNILEAGKASYDFDGLLAQLEQSGGAAVQQSAHDQRVAKAIDQALDENFTTRGVKKSSPLYEREAARDMAEMAMEHAKKKLNEYETAGDDLAAIVEQLNALQYKELPELEQRKQRISEGADASAKLNTTIELATKAAEPLRLRQETAQKNLAVIDQLQAQLNEQQSKWSELLLQQDGAEAKEQQLTAALEAQRSSRSRLGEQKQQLEQRQQLLQLLVDQARCQESHKQQTAELEQRRQGQAKRLELEQQLAALASVGKEEVKQLRGLEQSWRNAATRKQAMAAGVKVLRADQDVRINGERLNAGEQRQLSSVFELQVGDGVALEITPGGGQALGDLDGQVKSAEQAFQSRLAALGVATLEAAEDCAEQRAALVQQRLALNAADQQKDLPSIQQELDGWDGRLAQLAHQIAELEQCRAQWQQQQALPISSAELQQLQRSIATTLTHTTNALRQSETDLESGQQTLLNFKKKQQEGASDLKVIKEQLADHQNRLAEEIQNNGNRESLSNLCDQLVAQHKQVEEELQKLQAEKATLGNSDQAQELAAVDAKIEALGQHIEQRQIQRGAAIERCNSISADDPYAAIEQARVQLETADADYQSLKRITDAHKLLQQLFTEAQTDLSSRYSEPLAQAIGSYLRPLVADGAVVQLNFDQSKGFSGLQLRRGGEYYDFENLSGGMKEQLAAALRLSMADVLKGSHDGSLPLIFDDAFTNSDPERVELMKQMLGTAVDRGLQVILLTCDPRAYGSFGDQTVMLNTAGVV